MIVDWRATQQWIVSSKIIFLQKIEFEWGKISFSFSPKVIHRFLTARLIFLLTFNIQYVYLELSKCFNFVSCNWLCALPFISEWFVQCTELCSVNLCPFYKCINLALITHRSLCCNNKYTEIERTYICSYLISYNLFKRWLSKMCILFVYVSKMCMYVCSVYIFNPGYKLSF